MERLLEAAPAGGWVPPVGVGPVENTDLPPRLPARGHRIGSAESRRGLGLADPPARRLVLQRDLGTAEFIEAPQNPAAMGKIGGCLAPVLVAEQS